MSSPCLLPAISSTPASGCIITAIFHTFRAFLRARCTGTSILRNEKQKGQVTPMASWMDIAKEITASALLASFEPNPVQFRPEHEYDVRRVREALRRAKDGKLARFRPPVNRNVFSWAASITQSCAQRST